MSFTLAAPLPAAAAAAGAAGEPEPAAAAATQAEHLRPSFLAYWALLYAAFGKSAAHTEQGGMAGSGVARAGSDTRRKLRHSFVTVGVQLCVYPVHRLYFSFDC